MPSFPGVIVNSRKSAGGSGSGTVTTVSSTDSSVHVVTGTTTPKLAIRIAKKPVTESTTPTNGQVATYTSTSGKWISHTASLSSDYLFGSGATGTFTAQNKRTATITFTKGSFTVTSTDANFTSTDIGQLIVTTTRACRITAVATSTNATVDQVFRGTSTTLAASIGGYIPFGNYVNVTIPEGVTTRVACAFPFTNRGFIFYCTDTFTIDGTLDLSGVNASGKTAPSSPVPGPATTAPSGSPTAGANSYLQWLLLGGNGGSTAVNSGGTSTWREGSGQYVNPVVMLVNAFTTSPSYVLTPAYGLAGGGGGKIPTTTTSLGTGGAGGGQGVFGIIVAKHIVHGDTNSHNLQGGNGGNGIGTNAGGGGGGAAGWWMTLSDTLTGTANITGTGGAGGSGIGTGTDGTAGQDGFGVHYLTGTVGPI